MFICVYIYRYIYIYIKILSGEYYNGRRWVDNIRMDLQEVGCGYMDWIGLVQDRHVTEVCECGNEPSDSVKCGEFLD